MQLHRITCAAATSAHRALVRFASSVPSSRDRFAGRFPLGKNLPTVETKQGMVFEWAPKQQKVRVLGGASSEVLGGSNLAEILRCGFEIEQRSFRALERNERADALSIHTSTGVPKSLNTFLDALQPHLPEWAQAEGDWCVNLQAEGSSAVHAAIDMCLQVMQPHDDLVSSSARTRVACGAASYHGPASTSPGGTAPLGNAAKGLTHPIRYPVPSPFYRFKDELDTEFHARLLMEFTKYLDTHAHELVLCYSNHSGAPVSHRRRGRHSLQSYVQEAKSRGLAVICDEVMRTRSSWPGPTERHRLLSV